MSSERPIYLSGLQSKQMPCCMLAMESQVSSQPLFLLRNGLIGF